MLIKKKIEEGTILAIKLTTGDEIIAKLVSINSDSIIIGKPIAVGMSQNGVAFVPFMIGADEKTSVMTIKDQHIITYVAARKELKDAYIQNTTGIEPAPTGSGTTGIIGQ